MARPFSVLIVEDHDPLQRTLAELLRDRGWNAYPTGAVADALAVARQVELDFGILDLHLPDDTGLALFRAIEKEMGLLPTIMLSGEATPTETDAALSAGVFSFLKKPIAIPTLQRSMDLLIEKHFKTPPGASRS